jgi:hypothetical protein
LLPDFPQVVDGLVYVMHQRLELYGRCGFREMKILVWTGPLLLYSQQSRRQWLILNFLMASSLVDSVIPSTSSGQALSVAVLQAERRISRYDTVCKGRSLGPLVKTRALRDDAL